MDELEEESKHSGENLFQMMVENTSVSNFICLESQHSQSNENENQMLMSAEIALNQGYFPSVGSIGERNESQDQLESLHLISQVPQREDRNEQIFNI